MARCDAPTTGLRPIRARFRPARRKGNRLARCVTPPRVDGCLASQTHAAHTFRRGDAFRVRSLADNHPPSASLIFTLVRPSPECVARRARHPTPSATTLCLDAHTHRARHSHQHTCPCNEAPRSRSPRSQSRLRECLAPTQTSSTPGTLHPKTRLRNLRHSFDARAAWRKLPRGANLGPAHKFPHLPA